MRHNRAVSAVLLAAALLCASAQTAGASQGDTGPPGVHAPDVAAVATGYMLAPLKVDLVVYLEVTPIRTLDAPQADSGVAVAGDQLSATIAAVREVEVPPGRERWRPRGTLAVQLQARRAPYDSGGAELSESG